MKPTQPIKRNEAIVEFSRDHHYSLLLVWKIREGIKKTITPERISNYVLHFYETELSPHFQNEENLLFNKIAIDNNLRNTAEADHAAIGRLVATLQKNPSDQKLLLQIADLLEKHIRFEERQLFNYLQETIPENEMAAIALQLKDREHEDESAWPDPFWKK
ncbi:MAG: hemerythrin domain-containing protein [Bacteroidetes bacterium]|nr:hemerythrin domain-containing protein [Bacteroidota bacterium]